MKHKAPNSSLRLLSVILLALCAAQAPAAATAEEHTVTFRRLNGTILSRVKVAHGGSVAAPEGPVEPDHTFKGWDHGDWLGCVTNDIQVWALYEGTKVWDAGTGYGSQSIAERDIPYSLEEYFQMYDNMAWADEFSREGTNDVRSTYWNYDTENRSQLNYETSGDNQKEIDGFLDINVRREKKTRREFDWSTFSYKTTEYDFTGGGLKSNGKVAFKHGRCEIRAKLTRQRGAWPAFWMMGNTGNWPECGELDVLEQPSGGDWIAGTFHLPMPGVNGGSIPNGHPTTPEDGVHFGDGFHRFGTIVNEREVVWYVDDHIFKRMDVRDSRYYMLRDRPLFIIFGMGLQSNTWVKAKGDAPVSKDDVPELDERGVDFLVDYCRIFTNTNAGNTASYEAAPAQARLSAPVTAAIWRGWDMTWGRPGSGAYQNNINKGYTERYYIKTALSEYFAREKTDVLTFLTEPTISTSANRAEFDIPDYSFLSISANANGWNSSDNPKLESGSYSNGRLPLFSSMLFNSKRFSVSSSCIDILKLSDEPAFTNCYAVCADLKEKATDARVKVISVNVIATNGVETAGSTVAQGFNTLFTTLDAVKDENVIVLLQGMDQKLLNYIKARADTALASPYHYLGNYSGTLTYQCAYATASVAASAKHPDPILVPKEAPSVSYTHNPQALQATVTFDAPITTDDGLSDTFDAATYAKSMTISFPDYTGAALSSFPVLVRLSTAISGFDYTGFLLPDGGDLRFTDASGNVIPHEVDTWNPDGESTVWVKVPLLTKSAAITAHWGCPRPVRPGAEGVWDGDYVGVWHLGESGLPLRESSGVSVDFTRSTGDSVVFAAGGIVGGAVDFAAAGRTNSVVALDNAALEGLARGTLEVWTKQVSHTQNAGILSKRAGYNSNISYFIYDNGSSTVLCLPGDTIGSNYVSCVSTTPAMNAWNHQAFTFDTAAASDNAKSYLNGLSKTTATKSVAAFSGIANLCLGAMQGGTAANYVGQIDEVRISKCVRSADWIQATHDTVAKANFATYAVEDAAAPAKLPFSRGTNCRGLDEKPYSTSRLDNSTYIYGLDNTFPDIKARGFDFVRFSVDLTKYYDTANDALITSGSYSIATIDTIMQKMLDAGLYVHLLMGRVDGGDLDLSNSEQKARFKKVWQRVAERYRNWSDHIAFELCNEPKANTDGTISQLNTLLAETVEVIRQTNQTRLILWPVADGSQPWILTERNGSLVKLPDDHSNIALVVHVYHPVDFTGQGASWSTDSNGNPRNYHVDLTDAHRSTLRWNLNQIKSYIDAHPDVPVILNEFGVMLGLSTPADATEYLSTVRGFCETNGIPWAHFEYVDFNNNMGMASRNGPTGEWRQTVIDALFPDAGESPDPPTPDPGIALSGATAEAGFSWTNATATVTATVADAAAIPAGAKVRLTVMDASGAVLGTADRAWTGDGEYVFDTSEAVSGAALFGYDYTLSFSVLPGSAGFQPAETSAVLRLGSAAPWFSADPATGEVLGGAWASGSADGPPAISNDAFVVADGTAFIADEARTGLVRAEIALPSHALVSESTLLALLAFAAAHGERAGLAPVEGDGGSIVWHGLVLQDGALAWKALQGGSGGQTAGSVTPIAMELDLTVPAAPRVSYLVRGERLRDAAGAAWFPAPGSGAVAEGVLDFAGGGSVGALAGYAYDKAVAETTDGTRHATLAEALAAGDVTLLTNVEWPEGAPVGTTAIDRAGHTLLQGGVAVEESSVVVTAGPVAIVGEGTLRVTFGKLESVGVATAGRTPAQIAADLAADGANGIPRWQSLVLGLDATDPDARPLADIAMDSASGAMSVSDAGLAVDESTGATVTYQVREIPDLADSSADVPVGDPASPGTPVALPMGDAASRFFRIQVRIALP